ncbi:hypothetical protein BDF14DRAFT_1304517 [Spinellus fusiger]|nr:hypothetical protein BDF14DRAFT_1304517 [Spinellus fusiger]
MKMNKRKKRREKKRRKKRRRETRKRRREMKKNDYAKKNVKRKNKYMLIYYSLMKKKKKGGIPTNYCILASEASKAALFPPFFVKEFTVMTVANPVKDSSEEFESTIKSYKSTPSSKPCQGTPLLISIIHIIIISSCTLCTQKVNLLIHSS